MSNYSILVSLYLAILLVSSDEIGRSHDYGMVTNSQFGQKAVSNPFLTSYSNFGPSQNFNQGHKPVYYKAGPTAAPWNPFYTTPSAKSTSLMPMHQLINYSPTTSKPNNFTTTQHIPVPTTSLMAIESSIHNSSVPMMPYGNHHSNPIRHSQSSFDPRNHHFFLDLVQQHLYGQHAHHHVTTTSTTTTTTTRAPSPSTTTTAPLRTIAGLTGSQLAIILLSLAKIVSTTIGLLYAYSKGGNFQLFGNNFTLTNLTYLGREERDMSGLLGYYDSDPTMIYQPQILFDNDFAKRFQNNEIQNSDEILSNGSQDTDTTTSGWFETITSWLETLIPLMHQDDSNENEFL